jgi:type IV secretory pathway VirB2 component (pilin)
MPPARPFRGKCHEKRLQPIEGPVAKIVAVIIFANGLAPYFDDT